MEIKKSKNTNGKINFLKKTIFAFPLVFIFLLILGKIFFLYQTNMYYDFAEEDGPIEYLTAVFYFSSCLFSAIIGIVFIKQKKNLFGILYLLLSVAFFFIAFEEISWGQRIFEIETTEFFEDNMQNETNFHNLPIMDGYKRLSILMVSFFGFVLWAVFTHSDKLKNKSFTKSFVPQTFTMPYFVIAMVYHAIDLFQINEISIMLTRYFFTWPDVEIYEFLLSAGIFIFITSKIIDLKNQKMKI